MMCCKEWREWIADRQAEFICLPVALLLVAWPVAHVILNMFYISGAYGDTATFSVLAWCNGWDLAVPQIHMGPKPAAFDTYFNTHMAWFFWLPSALSRLLPLDRITFFAWFEGGLYALLGLAFWLLLNDLWPARKPWAVLVKCAAVAAFALNGHAQSLLSQGHYEIAAPAFVLIFLWALAGKKRNAAIIAFVLALSLREDMGFHIFGLLFLWLIIDLLRGMAREERKTLALYASAAFAYSAVALALHHFAFQDWGIFQRHYLGPGPFNHVTAQLLDERLKNLLLHRYWIWGPGVIALVWALAARNPYIAIGWLAFVPWLLLSLLAKANIIGNLHLHYGFPFIIAGAWPLLAASRHFTAPRNLPPAKCGMALMLTVLLLAVQQPATIYPKFSLALWHLPWRAAEATSPRAYVEFERRLPQALAEVPALRADEGVFSIAPYALDPRVNKIKKKMWDEDTAGFDREAPTERKIEAVLYFKNGYETKYVTDLIRANGLDRHYRLSGTLIYMSTSRDIGAFTAFNGLFVPAEPPPPEAQRARHG